MGGHEEYEAHEGMSIKGMSIKGMSIKGMSIKGMRVKTGHPLALVCRSGRDRGTLGKKGHEDGLETRLYTG